MSKFLILLTILSILPLQALDVAPADRVVVDGKLDEVCWQKAERGSGFTMLTSRWPNAQKPLADTAFSVLADSGNIYIGVICYEPYMDKIVANIKDANTPRLWADDAVEIFFAPTGVSDEFYQFAVGAGGATFQMFFGEKGVIRPDAYAPVYDAKVFHGKDFWSVEMRIPLEALYMTRSKFWKSKWLFNVCRQRMNPDKYRWSSYAKLKGTFFEVDKFNKIDKFPLKPSAKDIYIKNVNCVMTAPDSGKLAVGFDRCGAPGGQYKMTIKSADLENVSPRNVTVQGNENIIEITPVEFKRTGKITVNVELRNQKGEIAAVRNYTANAVFVPMQLQLDSPAYSNAFFPGQRADRLQGKLKLLLDVDNVQVTCGTKTYKITAREAEKFDFPLEFPADGVVPVKFAMIKNNQVIYDHEIKIRKLPPLATTMVWIDNDRLVINGKNTFVLGWYGGEGEWLVSRALREKYPTQGAKHPVNVTNWVNLQVNRLVPGTEARESTRDVYPSAAVLDAVKKVIENNRKNNFELYYLEDEPECRAVSAVYLQHVYKYIKELDPYHPVMIISREPGKYVDCADILNPHPYLNPVVNEDGKRVLKSEVDVIRRRCEEIRKTCRRNKIIMLTPQTFSYNINNTAADYTNFDETNSSIWSAVCHGAQGITPYIWYAHCGRPSLSLGTDYIFTSLNRLGQILASPEKPLEMKCSNRMVDTHCIGYKGKYVIALVNISNAEQNAVIDLPPDLPVKQWYVFRENRQMQLADKKMTVALEPYQVMVLTSEKMDEALNTLADTRKLIEQNESARCNRGNILFGKHRDIEVSSSFCGYMYQTFMEQQDCMFDGVVNSISWLPRNYTELWYELAFPKFVPKFSKIRVWGDNLKGMKLMIWKFGEWKTPAAKITEEKYCTEYDFGKTWSTVKVRMEFPMRTFNINSKDRLELYEFEMLK